MIRRAGRLLLCACAWLLAGTLVAAPRTDREFADLLKLAALTEPALARVLATPERFDLQILWTRIAVPGQRERLRSLHYRVDPRQWFAAASLVKLPLALMALEELARRGWPLRGTYFEASWPAECTPALHSGPQLPPAREALTRTLTRLLVVSDNEASNRLYQWLGPPRTQDWLRRQGMADARIVRPLMVCSEAALQQLGGWRLSDAGNRTLLAARGRSTGTRPRFAWGEVHRGQAWLEDGKLSGPRDFSDANFVTLEQMQRLLMAVVRPDLLPAAQRLPLRDDDRRWLRELLSRRPAEFADPQWPAADFPDWYAKYFLIGDGTQIWPEGVRIYDKVGQSYGWLSDVAYIEDAQSGATFFLAAVLAVDLDGTLNDGHYAYDEIGLPFLTALGRVILAAERDDRGRSR